MALLNRTIRLRLLTVCGSVLVTLLAIALVDRWVVARWAPFRYGYPPNAHFEYKTSELHCTVVTNRHGLRDRDFDLDKGENFRILAIGDSFTFGWGVNIEQAWCKLLEQDLRSRGARVEVINAGRSGSGPKEYLLMADELIPRLKPDLVLIGVLQGDDLAQSLPDTTPANTEISTDTSWVPAFLRPAHWALCPNFIQWRQGWGASNNTAEDMVDCWKNDAKQRWETLTPEERGRFDALDAEVQRRFHAGDLNPPAIIAAVRTPRYFSMTLHPETEESAAHAQVMTRCLEKIRSVSAQHGARTLVVSIPYGCYTSRADLEFCRRRGYQAEESFLTSDAPDHVIATACSRAGVKFITVFADFRKRAQAQRLYFEWDGHFNALGNQVFADLIAPILAEEVGR